VEGEKQVDSRRAQIGSAGASKLSVTERFDELLQHALGWVLDNSRMVVAGLVGALLIGALAAGTYEWLQWRSEAAFDELAKVQITFDKAMPQDLGATETANPEIAAKNLEIAKAAREAALTGFDEVSKRHSGTLAGTAAGLSAARIEIVLGKLPEADQRLAQLAETADDDVSRATVLRLRAYVLEETGHEDQAADLYAQVGAIEAYPGRIQAYVQAAETYQRLGKVAPAIQAFEALTLVAPEYAERADILPQLEALRARQARETGSEPTPPAPTPAPAEPAPAAPAPPAPAQ
jgi:tetratricopeptide (TPR) repeat protein